jgi:hypothetical protein
MNNLNAPKADSLTSVEDVGGETLAGSGFENEIPEPDFTKPESSNESEAR